MKVYMGMCLMLLRIFAMAVFREFNIKEYSVGVAKLGTDYCPLYGVAGCPLFRGF